MSKISYEDGLKFVEKGWWTKDALEKLVEEGKVSKPKVQVEKYTFTDVNGVKVSPVLSFKSIGKTTKGFKTNHTPLMVEMVNKINEILKQYSEKEKM